MATADAYEVFQISDDDENMSPEVTRPTIVTKHVCRYAFTVKGLLNRSIVLISGPEESFVCLLL